MDDQLRPETDEDIGIGQPEPDPTPVAAEILETPEFGLEPRAQAPKRVIVIGAGMAGLVAAFELARQGHDPIVLEAQNRVGGRVYTMRYFAPGLYAEAGAMRIPRVHDLTLEYCDLFGLELRPFVMGNPKALVHIGGQRMTAEEAAPAAGSAAVRARRARARPDDRRALGGGDARPPRAARRGGRAPAGPRSSASTTSTRSASSSSTRASPRARSRCTASSTSSRPT